MWRIRLSGPGGVAEQAASRIEAATWTPGSSIRGQATPAWCSAGRRTVRARWPV